MFGWFRKRKRSEAQASDAAPAAEAAAPAAPATPATPPVAGHPQPLPGSRATAPQPPARPGQQAPDPQALPPQHDFMRPSAAAQPTTPAPRVPESRPSPAATFDSWELPASKPAPIVPPVTQAPSASVTIPARSGSAAGTDPSLAGPERGTAGSQLPPLPSMDDFPPRSKPIMPGTETGASQSEPRADEPSGRELFTSGRTGREQAAAAWPRAEQPESERAGAASAREAEDDAQAPAMQPQQDSPRDSGGGHVPAAQLHADKAAAERLPDFAVPKARPSMPLSSSPSFAGLGLAKPEPVSPELLEPTAALSEEAREELQALLMDMFGPEGRYRLEWRDDRTPGDDRTFSQIMVADLVRRIQNAIAAADGLELTGRPSLAEILAADDAAADAHLRELATAASSSQEEDDSPQADEEKNKPESSETPDDDGPGTSDDEHEASDEPREEGSEPLAEHEEKSAEEEAPGDADSGHEDTGSTIAEHDDAVIGAVLDSEPADDELTELVQQTHPGLPKEIKELREQQRKIA